MQLDTKQKVLVAIYIEYQKDIPDMGKNIKSNILGIDAEVFVNAISKLMNEEYITEVDILRGGIGGKIQSIILRDMMITRDGIEYVETKIGIDKTLNGIEKVKYISKKAVEAGWDKGTDIAAKVLAELIKS
ncbi:YjcQ family protein [Clostridium estertheticum]|uniref:YjcQ family protein n=1 Tax=Clostridium estertheticum TaxID=238834 RepID=UPI001C0DAE50|nr:YjcQ family protein [Clostridium estertheticum]MBU3176079.1 YjcQ family protein [Clostridium estertheticum]